MKNLLIIYEKSLRYRKIYLGVSILLAIIILLISITPYSKIKEVGYPEISDIFDMINHFIGFCIFNFFLISTFLSYKSKNSFSSKYILLYLSIAIFWGAVCETSQLFNPTRKFQFIDIIANTSPPFIILYIFRKLL